MSLGGQPNILQKNKICEHVMLIECCHCSVDDGLKDELLNRDVVGSKTRKEDGSHYIIIGRKITGENTLGSKTEMPLLVSPFGEDTKLA